MQGQETEGFTQRWHIIPSTPERGFTEVKIYAKEWDIDYSVWFFNSISCFFAYNIGNSTINKKLWLYHAKVFPTVYSLILAYFLFFFGGGLRIITP